MATTNPKNPPVENKTGSTFLGGPTVKLGSIDVGSSFVAKSEVIGINIPQGSYNPRPNALFKSDRAPNVASGFNVQGNPTFGSGKRNQNITFNPDYSYASPQAKFTYGQPLRPSGYKYDDLV